MVGTMRCKEPESCWWFIKNHFLCGLTKLALDALDVLLVWIKNGRFVWSCRTLSVLLVNQRWLLSLRNRLAPAPLNQPPHPFHCYPFLSAIDQCPMSIVHPTSQACPLSIVLFWHHFFATFLQTASISSYSILIKFSLLKPFCRK